MTSEYYIWIGKCEEKHSKTNTPPQSKIKNFKFDGPITSIITGQVAGIEWEKVFPFFKKWGKWVTAVKECWSFEPTVSCP